MKDQSKMSNHPMSGDTPSVTSLPGSEHGPLRSEWLDGQTTDQCGPGVVPANHSPRRAREMGLLTSGTYGQLSFITSFTENQEAYLSLVNRLRARMDSLGSTLFNLTWKERATPSGRSIYALRASVRRTPGSAYSSLPTPSGTSNHGKNHVSGRLDEWGGSGNPFRGTEIGKLHSPKFELWMMGFPETWAQQMPSATLSSRKRRKSSSSQ